MDTKINLLFDGRIIADFLRSKKTYPSGVFFVSLNLLETFLDDERYNVSLYISDRKRIGRVKRFFSPGKLKIVFFQDRSLFIKNIRRHKQIIQASRNILKKTLFCLKILKNLLRLAWYGYYPYSKTLKEFNVFLSPAYGIPEEVGKYPHIRRFIVIHDLIPFLGLSCYAGKQFHDDHFINEIFKNLDYDGYFFVSENSRQDFIRYASGRVDEKKTMVTYIAVSHDFVPLRGRGKLTLVLEKYRAGFDLKNKYIFSICSLEPRKNLIFTINCFIKFIQKNNILDLYFILGGAAWDNYKDIYLNETNSIGGEYKNKIIHLGYVDDADVNILYSNSLFFAFLSKYEGFGMPPLEAMQAGTPVISSNNSSLPEVVGDAAIMIDCESEEQCIKAFETLYYDEKLREDYIKKGIERAKLFTWKKTVDKMTEAIIAQLNCRDV